MTDEPTQAIDMQNLTTQGEILSTDTVTPSRDPFVYAAPSGYATGTPPRVYKRVDMSKAFCWGLAIGCLIMLAVALVAAKL